MALATEHLYIVTDKKILSGEPKDEINAHIERNRAPEDLIDPLVKDLG